MTQDSHQDAFDYYRALGPKRTLNAVAKQMGVSVSTVKLWSRQGQWRQRLREHDANAARQAADRVIQSSANETDRNLKIVRVALMKVAKAIAEGKVKIQMGDLDRLVRLEGYLNEQKPDHGRPDLAGLTDEQLIARMRTLRDQIDEDLARYDGQRMKERVNEVTSRG